MSRQGRFFIVIRASCGFIVTVNVPPATFVCCLHFIPSCCCIHWCPNTRVYYAHLTALTFSISILSHQNTKYNSVLSKHPFSSAGRWQEHKCLCKLILLSKGQHMLVCCCCTTVFQVPSFIYFLYGVFQLFYNRFIISMYFSSSVSSVSSGVPREPIVSYTHSFLLACSSLLH